MSGRDASAQCARSELERSFSVGVVRQLFEPLLASLSKWERADVLAGAAALVDPRFTPKPFNAETRADSWLATLHGLYWLSANLAAGRPLLLAMDNLYWCDLTSPRWLAYLLPRMEGLAGSVPIGLRPAEVGEDPGLLDEIAADPLEPWPNLSKRRSTRRSLPWSTSSVSSSRKHERAA